MMLLLPLLTVLLVQHSHARKYPKKVIKWLRSWTVTFVIFRLTIRPCHLTLVCVSGLHTYQKMMGCKLLEDSSTTGFLQYASDGQDFIISNTDALSWVAQAWEVNLQELQYQKNWLEEECIAWLKRFLEYGKDTLERTGKEKRELCSHIPRKTNFMKNGEEIAQEVDYGGVLPSGDGTYQMWVSVDPDPQSKDVYLVLWSTLAPRESESILLTVKVISGPIILTIVLAGAGVLTWRRSREEVIYHPTKSAGTALPF
uniref:MHC class I-like antigen recognition-like domain-containing protein n=1 Tax=Cricetulus griseus TaxID=10029 RepID=A0A8C2MF40_CRIGR